MTRPAFGATQLFVGLCAGAALAQSPPPQPADDASEPFAAEKAGKTLRAMRLTVAVPTIDGLLDDAIWTMAETIDDFVQWEPENLVPLTERTVAQVAHDDRFLYVAVRAYDRDPAGVAAGLGRRDDFPPTDRVEIGFDPRHDHLTGYLFQTNPSGVQGDQARFNDTRIDRDYDAVWEVGTRVTAEGWTAEFRIPFSQMRFSVESGQPTVWGFTVRRTIHRKGEFGEWVGRPRGEQGGVSWWGHLVFGDDFSAPPRRVELLPYVLGGSTRLAGAGAEHNIGGGLDLRVGLGSSATLSATFNPDFAQVEQDPAVLNLTVFESFFPERRPFFLEDSRTFVPGRGGFQLFHSRRIGRRPGRFSLETGDQLVERPEQTTILGAAKITGKTSRWTYGVMSALTAREFATVDAETGDDEILTRVERVVEPLTTYNVGRLQRDVGSASTVGALVTGAVRELDVDAFTGGIDHNIRWNRSRFAWTGNYAVSRAPGTDGVRSDWGGNGGLSFFGKHFGFDTFYGHTGRDFRVNDLGFQRGRVDETNVAGGLAFRQPDPWSVLRRVQSFTSVSRTWNTAGLPIGRFANTGLSLTFKNFWNVNVNVGRRSRAEDDLDTRGGPPIVTPASTFLNFFLNSDSRKTWSGRLGLNGQRDEEGGWNARISPSISVQPSPRLQASFGVGYNLGQSVAQWITNEDVTGDDETDYVYGRLRRDVIDVTVRATYAVHRDLTLQLFLQPFVAAGDYTDIKRLARVRSFDFEPAEISFNPDFNTKSLRGNAVLRWEYVRGSTLFFVWNVSTFDDARPGVFDPWRDLGDAFAGDGTHAFMVKATYWLSR
jgi:hypothetical protein